MNTNRKPLNQLIADTEEKAAAEQRQEIEREARASEALRCAADVCEYCKSGEIKPIRREHRWWHDFGPGMQEVCDASDIHERLHREAQERAKPR